MASGDTRSTRRPTWPWIVAAGIVVVLAVGAWFAAEAIARRLVVDTVRTQITTNLALPADQVIDVEVPGAVIPQLIAGTLDEIRISSEDVVIDAFRGDISVRALDVPIRGGELGSADATVRLDQEQLRILMDEVESFPSETLGIADPDVTASVELSFFGVTVPVAVALTPSSADGELVLTPASLQVAGAEVTADELRRQFGIVSNAVLRDWPVCIATYLPAGLVLTGVEVDDEQLVARFDIDPAILTDQALLEDGSC